MKKINTLEEWIQALKESRKLVVVEGRKDKEALQKLGITNIKIIQGHPLYEIIEEINSPTIILTDLDKEGKKLYAKIKHELQKKGVKIDVILREFLFRQTTLSHIEGIIRYKKKEEKYSKAL